MRNSIRQLLEQGYGNYRDLDRPRHVSPYHDSLNKYPTQAEQELTRVLASERGIDERRIIVGNGTEELVDVLMRSFCESGKDNVLTIAPTRTLYRRWATINAVECGQVLLAPDFTFCADRLLAACDSHTKIIFLCTPNMPTGNQLATEEVVKVIKTFQGLVVVDESFADLSLHRSYRNLLGRYDNLVVLESMSHYWACAALRMGMAYASTAVVDVMRSIRAPWSVSLPQCQEAIATLKNKYDVEKWNNIVVQERQRLSDAFRLLPMCRTVYTSSANFILVKMDNAAKVVAYLKQKGIAVKDCHNDALCDNCLCISIGSRSENNALVGALRQM